MILPVLGGISGWCKMTSNMGARCVLVGGEMIQAQSLCIWHDVMLVNDAIEG